MKLIEENQEDLLKKLNGVTVINKVNEVVIYNKGSRKNIVKNNGYFLLPEEKFLEEIEYLALQKEIHKNIDIDERRLSYKIKKTQFYYNQIKEAYENCGIIMKFFKKDFFKEVEFTLKELYVLKEQLDFLYNVFYARLNEFEKLAYIEVFKITRWDVSALTNYWL